MKKTVKKNKTSAAAKRKFPRLKIGVVTSMFNEDVTQPLEAGTLDYLSECDVEVYSVRVPGAVEIPLAAQALFDYKKIDGVKNKT